MKYAIYQDPLTRKFALVQLPHGFAEGDRVPILPTEHWFDTHAEAVAALPALLDLET